MFALVLKIPMVSGMKILFFALVTSFLCMIRVSPLHAKELRVFISVDMEGIAGVVNGAQLAPGEFEYEKFRRLMTAEANACIEGAFAAGATKITVSDSHGNGLSLLPDELNPKVRLIRSWPRPLEMMDGIDGGFDAAILIGYHASIGTPGAVRAHTMSSKRFYDMRLNGKHASEAMLSAAMAGHYGVPVVLVSGDDKAVEEIQKTIDPKIVGVVVKRAIGYHSADNISPQASRALISAQTKAALTRLGDFKPYTLAKPVKLEIAFKNMLNAEILSLLPIVERIDGSTIRFIGKDIIEAMRFITFIAQYNNAD
jgi:D-amino peptidase